MLDCKYGCYIVNIIYRHKRVYEWQSDVTSSIARVFVVFFGDFAEDGRRCLGIGIDRVFSNDAGRVTRGAKFPLANK